MTERQPHRRTFREKNAQIVAGLKVKSEARVSVSPAVQVEALSPVATEVRIKETVGSRVRTNLIAKRITREAALNADQAKVIIPPIESRVKRVYVQKENITTNTVREVVAPVAQAHLRGRRHDRTHGSRGRTDMRKVGILAELTAGVGMLSSSLGGGLAVTQTAYAEDARTNQPAISAPSNSAAETMSTLDRAVSEIVATRARAQAAEAVVEPVVTTSRAVDTQTPVTRASRTPEPAAEPVVLPSAATLPADTPPVISSADRQQPAAESEPVVAPALVAPAQAAAESTGDTSSASTATTQPQGVSQGEVATTPSDAEILSRVNDQGKAIYDAHVAAGDSPEKLEILRNELFKAYDQVEAGLGADGEISGEDKGEGKDKDKDKEEDHVHDENCPEDHGYPKPTTTVPKPTTTTLPDQETTTTVGPTTTTTEAPATTTTVARTTSTTEATTTTVAPTTTTTEVQIQPTITTIREKLKRAVQQIAKPEVVQVEQPVIEQRVLARTGADLIDQGLLGGGILFVGNALRRLAGKPKKAS